MAISTLDPTKNARLPRDIDGTSGFSFATQIAGSYFVGSVGARAGIDDSRVCLCRRRAGRHDGDNVRRYA